MGVLDQVMDLKSNGLTDREISKRLQQQGYSPADISDALSKAQIKNAVSDSDDQGPSTAGMQPSILNSEDPNALPTEEPASVQDADLTPPMPSNYSQSLPAQMTQEVSENNENAAQDRYSPQEEYYPQPAPQPQPQYNYNYSGEEQMQPQPQDYGYNYAPATGGGTDTMIEIAEQVFSEKSKPLQKKSDDLEEFRALAQTKIDSFSDRLKRIESIIDNLQISILEKVGSYGHGLDVIRKELGMMQDSFGKMANKVASASERHTPHPGSGHVTMHKSERTTKRRRS